VLHLETAAGGAAVAAVLHVADPGDADARRRFRTVAAALRVAEHHGLAAPRLLGHADGDDDDGDGDGDDTPILLPPPAPREAAAMRARLRELLGTRWNRRWLKKADKRPRKPKAKKPLPGGHASVWKLMQAAKRERAEKS
jgi:hypothetical protein